MTAAQAVPCRTADPKTKGETLRQQTHPTRRSRVSSFHNFLCAFGAHISYSSPTTANDPHPPTPHFECTNGQLDDDGRPHRECTSNIAEKHRTKGIGEAGIATARQSNVNNSLDSAQRESERETRPFLYPEQTHPPPPPPPQLSRLTSSRSSASPRPTVSGRIVSRCSIHAAKH